MIYVMVLGVHFVYNTQVWSKYIFVVGPIHTILVNFNHKSHF